MDAFRGSRILIAGGTGLVGARLTGALLQQGAEVLILSRNPDDAHLPHGAQAHGWQALPGILEGCCAVINLTGEGIADHRWTPARKKALESSRMGPTRSLLSALEKARERPSVLINASAIGIYGTRAPEPTQEPIDEAEALGKGFLPELCRAWEAAADPAQALGVRVVKLRTGVVLAREGGALPKIAPARPMLRGHALRQRPPGLQLDPHRGPDTADPGMHPESGLRGPHQCHGTSSMQPGCLHAPPGRAPPPPPLAPAGLPHPEYPETPGGGDGRVHAAGRRLRPSREGPGSRLQLPVFGAGRGSGGSGLTMAAGIAFLRTHPGISSIRRWS